MSLTTWYPLNKDGKCLIGSGNDLLSSFVFSNNGKMLHLSTELDTGITDWDYMNPISITMNFRITEEDLNATEDSTSGILLGRKTANSGAGIFWRYHDGSLVLTPFIGNTILSTDYDISIMTNTYYTIILRSEFNKLILTVYDSSVYKSEVVLPFDSGVIFENNSLLLNSNTASISEEIFSIGLLNCDISNLRIYDHSLSETEIDTLIKSPILHIDFDDYYIFEPTICDVSGYNRNGQRIGEAIDTKVAKKVGINEFLIEPDSSPTYIKIDMGDNIYLDYFTISFTIRNISSNNLNGLFSFSSTENLSREQFFITQLNNFIYLRANNNIEDYLEIPFDTNQLDTHKYHIVRGPHHNGCCLYRDGILIAEETTHSLTSGTPLDFRYVYLNLAVDENGTQYSPAIGWEEFKIINKELTEEEILEDCKVAGFVDNNGRLFARTFISEESAISEIMNATGISKANSFIEQDDVLEVYENSINPKEIIEM